MNKHVAVGLLLFFCVNVLGIGLTYLTGNHLKYHKVFCDQNKCTYRVLDVFDHNEMFYEAKFDKSDLKKTWFYVHKIRHGYSLQASTNNLSSCKRINSRTNKFYDCMEKFYKADISPIFFTKRIAGKFYVKMIRKTYFKYTKIDLLFVEGELSLLLLVILYVVIAKNRSSKKEEQVEQENEEDDDEDDLPVKKNKKIEK